MCPSSGFSGRKVCRGRRNSYAKLSNPVVLAFGGAATTKRCNDNSAAPNCQRLVEEWLKECENEHTICKVQRDFLPTRLLDLGKVDEKQRLRLVNSRDCDPTSHYVTLSHCWGLHVPIQLTSDTEKEMRAGFDLDLMPPTFLDAIQIARWAKGKRSRFSLPMLAYEQTFKCDTSGSTLAVSFSATHRTGKMKPRR
jgi:hypothetical protein